MLSFTLGKHKNPPQRWLGSSPTMYFWNSLPRMCPWRQELQEDQLPFLPQPAFKAEPCFFPCLRYHCSRPRVTYLTCLGCETCLELLAGTRAPSPCLPLFLPDLLEFFHSIAICWKASCSKRPGNISESPDTRLSIPCPGPLTLKLGLLLTLVMPWVTLSLDPVPGTADLPSPRTASTSVLVYAASISSGTTSHPAPKIPGLEGASLF